MTESQRRWIAKNREWKRASDRAYYARNREQILERRKTDPAFRERERKWKRAHRAKNPEKIKEYRRKKRLRAKDVTLRRKYGLTLEQFISLRAQQSECCAICKNPLGEGHKVHVDHDHTTGAVRGILCNGCNMALGKFKDSAELLESAIRYLRGIR